MSSNTVSFPGSQTLHEVGGGELVSEPDPQKMHYVGENRKSLGTRQSVLYSDLCTLTSV